MSNYYEIMAEPLPRAEEFGFEPPAGWRDDSDALIEAADRFKGTEGYWLWQIAMSEWMMRRVQAEIDRQADSDGAYAEWVRRNNPATIAYEQRNIAEYEHELAKLRAHAA